jgi:hypothetical protein
MTRHLNVHGIRVFDFPDERASIYVRGMLAARHAR